MDPDVFLHVADYMEMLDIAQLRATCESNRLLFSSSNVIGQALVNQYGAMKGVMVAINHCHEKVALWICRNFTNQVHWWTISAIPNFPENLAREFQNELKLWYIHHHNILSEDLIRYCKDNVIWTELCSSQRLSEDFIREFQNKVDWKEISARYKYSEKFIREFQDSVDWKTISAWQDLSEDFIREFQDKVYWKYIFECQNSSEPKMAGSARAIRPIFSKEFKEEFSDRIH